MSIHIFRFSVQLINVVNRDKKLNGEKMSPLPGYRERIESRKTLYLSPNEIHFDIRELRNTNK